MLVLTRSLEERVVIQSGDTRIEVVVCEFRGDKVRLGFVAPPHVVIHRQEVQDAIDREAQHDPR